MEKLFVREMNQLSKIGQFKLLNFNPNLRYNHNKYYNIGINYDDQRTVCLLTV